jgi:hypothetical protein
MEIQKRQGCRYSTIEVPKPKGLFVWMDSLERRWYESTEVLKRHKHIEHRTGRKCFLDEFSKFQRSYKLTTWLMWKGQRRKRKLKQQSTWAGKYPWSVSSVCSSKYSSSLRTRISRRKMQQSILQRSLIVVLQKMEPQPFIPKARHFHKVQ